MARLPTDLLNAVRFAQWAAELQINPIELAELVRLARRAFRAGERYANSGAKLDSDREIRAGLAVERHAKALGLTTQWPGLWPTFVVERTGHATHLPIT
jgi:hypothetical protein